ncbi:hypothetical protein ACSBR1_021941 [Camellia fascicularis]
MGLIVRLSLSLSLSLVFHRRSTSQFCLLIADRPIDLWSVCSSLTLVSHRRSISAFSSQLCAQLHFESHSLVLRKIDSAQVGFTWTLLHFESVFLNLLFFESAHSLTGVEVKAGQPLKVIPQLGKVIHISQGALGEGKKEKGNDLIPLRVKINGEKFVVGSLSAENFPQVTFDLVFEKDFELSHDWKNGSVYFCGYSADNPFVYPSNSFLIMLNFMCLQIIIFFIINV